ncbi:zinc finger protein 276 [Rhinophrynus dorsalis]
MKRERRRRSEVLDRRRPSRGVVQEETGVPHGDGGSQSHPNLETDERKQSEGKALSSGYCRLCHGKFSSRSLRHAFGKVPVTGLTLEKQKRLDQVFFADFQQLVGISVWQDPELPQFVCKDCHAQFYKCRSVLRTFIQRVNTSPTNPYSSRTGKMYSVISGATGPCADLITSSPECLHGLVNWTHNHAGDCSSVPSLQQVVFSQYCGIIRTVWACGGGHNYVMETDSNCTTPSTQLENDMSTMQMPSNSGTHINNAETVTAPSGCHPSDMIDHTQSPPDTGGIVSCTPQRSPTLCLETPASLCSALDSSQGQDCRNPSLDLCDITKEKYGNLSDGDIQSREEGEERGDQLSSDDSFVPYSEKRTSQRKRKQRQAKKPSSARERKKPGPKPGWKKIIKCEREELPTIYKCHYQGCTAVHRGSDGMKKHIKEHHEEVRERPCPHPGCNKVFMIDRYLQRHVKLIHTEERNYICDQCGQAFKQRKHLSVHQMRHSGAKPLQCEVCGFQCRQRASLKYHMTKHKAETDLEFACDQCGKRFEKARNLSVHMAMVHPLTQNSTSPQGQVNDRL